MDEYTFEEVTINRVTTLVTKGQTVNSHQIKTKVRKRRIKILTTRLKRESHAGFVTKEITPKWNFVSKLNKANP
jgi:DNA-binding HxlR family transcriptional regulator